MKCCIITEPSPCDANPCASPGVCTASEDGNRYTCHCTPNSDGVRCQTGMVEMSKSWVAIEIMNTHKPGEIFETVQIKLLKIFENATRPSLFVKKHNFRLSISECSFVKYPEQFHFGF